MNQHVTVSPPLDAEPVILQRDPIPPAASPQDWEQLVTPGHVLRDRLAGRSALWFSIGLLTGIAALAVAIKGPSIVNFAVPGIGALASLDDPATWTDLGQGVKTSYKLNMLGGLSPMTGLTTDAWIKLVDAVSTDAGKFGFDTDKWEATTAIEPAPRVTRPEKLLAEKVDRLATGSVSVPALDSPYVSIEIVGWVEGKLAWVSLTNGYCATAFGPAVPDCEQMLPTDPRMVEHLVQYLPAPVEANE